MSTRYEVFASVTPGLEAALRMELKTLFPDLKMRSSHGGLSFRCSREELWCLSWRSRLAESVRVRIGRFSAPSFRDLEAGLRRLPWAAYLAPQVTLNVQVSAKKSALYHTGAITERVGRVLQRPVVGAEVADIRLWIRVVKDRVTVSVDAGGGLLHRRGWRQAVGRAPMRETLAAACLRLAEFDEAQALWDPFCGSGTLPIEAALERSGAPAQAQRVFAFERWPSFKREPYEVWRGGLPQPRQTPPLFFGSERCAQTLEGARANAKRAGVEHLCTWLEGDFEAHIETIPEGAAVVTNLPYGKRLSGRGKNLALFKRLGELLRRRGDLNPVVVLNGAQGFREATGMTWRTIERFKNRGTQTELLGLQRRASG